MEKIEIKQEDEIQCQGCEWWLRRSGNTCFPRVWSWLMSPGNEKTEAAHKASFTEDCPFK